MWTPVGRPQPDPPMERPPSAPTFLDVQAAGVVPRGAGSTDAPVGGKLRVTYGYKLLLVMTVMMLMMVARARLR